MAERASMQNRFSCLLWSRNHLSSSRQQAANVLTYGLARHFQLANSMLLFQSMDPLPKDRPLFYTLHPLQFGLQSQQFSRSKHSVDIQTSVPTLQPTQSRNGFPSLQVTARCPSKGQLSLLRFHKQAMIKQKSKRRFAARSIPTLQAERCGALIKDPAEQVVCMQKLE